MYFGKKLFMEKTFDNQLTVLHTEVIVQQIPPQERAFGILRLGTGLSSSEDFCRAILESGFLLNTWSREALFHPDFVKSTASKGKEVKLFLRSTEEIGFPDGTTLPKIYTRLKELGFILCPAEVGPQLRLQWPDQRFNDTQNVLVAMEPITIPSGCSIVFRIGFEVIGDENHGPCIDAEPVGNGRWVHPSTIWVLLRHY